MPANFMAGSIVLAYLLCGLFFLKIWRRGHDEFFLWLALAFALLGIERAIIAFYVGSTTISLIYLIRVLAFSLIIFAIVRKNRQQD